MPTAAAGVESEARSIPRICRRLVTVVGAPLATAMFALAASYELWVVISRKMPRNVLGPLLIGTGSRSCACCR